MLTIFTVAWACWLILVVILMGLLAWSLSPTQAPNSPVLRLRHLHKRRLARGRAWQRCVN